MGFGRRGRRSRTAGQAGGNLPSGLLCRRGNQHGLDPLPARQSHHSRFLIYGPPGPAPFPKRHGMREPPSRQDPLPIVFTLKPMIAIAFLISAVIFSGGTFAAPPAHPSAGPSEPRAPSGKAPAEAATESGPRAGGKSAKASPTAPKQAAFDSTRAFR